MEHDRKGPRKSARTAKFAFPTPGVFSRPSGQPSFSSCPIKGPKNQGKSSLLKPNQGGSSHFETFFLGESGGGRPAVPRTIGAEAGLSCFDIRHFQWNYHFESGGTCLILSHHLAAGGLSGSSLFSVE
jgi:hypothetical protein